MTTIDFARSFLTFRIDTTKKPTQTASHRPPFSLNNARIQIECRLRVTDKQSLQTQTFVLGANCKTERVGVTENIWTEPNADFVPIFSDTHFMHLKTYATTGEGVPLYPPGSGTQSERQSGAIVDAFEDVRIDLVDTIGSELKESREIIAATLTNRRLNAQTTIENDRYKAVIEYPVRTMNANERDKIYQTDTGPVLFPDLACEPEQILSRLQLAYAAFNCPDWVEFLIRQTTTITDDISVYHYSESLRFDARNEIVAIE